MYNIQTVDPVTGASVVDPTATSGPNDLLHPPGSAWYAATVQDGALPTKGLTLPLMSYGGSAILMNMVAIAIVMRIDAENKQMMRPGGRS